MKNANSENKKEKIKFKTAVYPFKDLKNLATQFFKDLEKKMQTHPQSS